MAATLLQLVKDATNELALNEPGVVFGSTDQDVKQLMNLSNAVGQELQKVFEWRALRTEYTFPTVAAQSTYTLPSDFDRLISDTEWDRTSRWPGIGPISPQEWQWLKGQNIAGVPRYRWRLSGINTFEIYPAPGGIYTYACEYISKNWVLASDGVTYRARWGDDTDVHLYDDRLMVAGLKARYLAAKGLDSSIAQQEYTERLEVCQSQDQSARKINLAGQAFPPLIGPWSVPDGSW